MVSNNLYFLVVTILVSVNIFLNTISLQTQAALSAKIAAFITPGPRHTPEDDREALRLFKLDLDRDREARDAHVDKRLAELDKLLEVELLELHRLQVSLEQHIESSEAQAQKHDNDL
jgi:hypothetical protein